MVLSKLPVPGRPTIWITVGQGPTALAVGAGGGCLDIFTLIYPFFPLSPSLWETARYRPKYCLKGSLNPKPTNQPTNQPSLRTDLEHRRPQPNYFISQIPGQMSCNGISGICLVQRESPTTNNISVIKCGWSFEEQNSDNLGCNCRR